MPKWHSLFRLLPIALLTLGAAACSDDDPTGNGGPPATPTGVTASSGGRTSCSIDWSDVSGATSYIVERSTGGAFAAIEESPVTQSGVSDAGLVEGTQYTYRVSSRNDDGTSSPSATASCAPASGAPVTVADSIAANRTFSADSVYILSGNVFVNSGVVLTIQPGALILGDRSTRGTLLVLPGGRIEAVGTRENPIVFTSAQDPGTRASGDWGGVGLAGRAPVNCPGGTCLTEGLNPPFGYGGSDPADDSGTFRFVRIEFAGIEISEGNELNGLTLWGVGSGTEIDFVQIHRGLDDGFEFFGGSVNAKHLVATGNEDDNFDWDEGWSGRGQFWIVQQVVEQGNNGIEADNNSDNNDLIPRSNPTVFNLTLVGSCTPGSADSDIAMLLREGTAGIVRNAIVTGWAETGLDIDQAATVAQVSSGALNVTNSIFFENTPDEFSSDVDEIDESAFALDASRSNRVVDPQLADPCNTAAPNFAPAAGSPALTGAASVPSDPFFTPVSYVGAVAGASDDWYLDWTDYPVN